MAIEDEIKQIQDAGGGPKDVARYLQSKGISFSVQEPENKKDILGNQLVPVSKDDIFAKLSSKIAGSPIVKTGQRIDEELSKRGQGLARGASLGYLKTDKTTPGSEFIGGLIPYTVASPIGAPLRAIKGASALASGARIAGAAVPMATVGALRPAKDLKERLKNAAVEGAIGATFQGLGEAKAAIFKPKETFYSLGTKLQNGLKELRQEAGKAVGAEKEAVKALKVKINTRPLIEDTNKLVSETYTSAGSTPLAKSDISAIEDVLRNLAENKANPSPKTLVQTKELIDSYVKYGKPGQNLPKVEGYGRKILIDLRSQIDKGLSAADSSGTWKSANEKYAKVSSLYDQAKSLFGDDLRLSDKMERIGKELADGNEGYLNFFKQMESVVPSRYSKAITQLEQLGLKSRAYQDLRSAGFVGSLLKSGEAAKSYSRYLGSKISNSINPYAKTTMGIGMQKLKSPEAIPSLLSVLRSKESKKEEAGLE